ncbi:winged helix-turn-helix transcriptional regulator [Nigerium massiliense]|uniref:winged helix-turn-helix transcriptional regulator n=1 Tax=Nigerium massiliense TaxID=1522317 RepID=UPI0005908D09|nr:response regulator transcription factor [Nigerium massiliense]
MARLLLVSSDATLPVLEQLSHEIVTVLPDADALTASLHADVVIVDARHDLAAARVVCRLLAAGSPTPVLLLVTDSGFATVGSDWGFADLVGDHAGPIELSARLRLLLAGAQGDGVTTAGGITIDEGAYHATLQGSPLDLTYTEFELLKYLVQHPGRVFSREQLLADVWGYDYYGGTRTVDVHVRRLRAKLGPEYESLIGTVRNVGYRFSPQGGPRSA